MAKRGRRPNHYVTSDGETILGLSRRPSDGRWRVIGTDTVFTEPDEKLAIHRYRCLQAEQRRSMVTFSKPLSTEEMEDDDEFLRRVEDFRDLVIDRNGAMSSETEIPEEVFWAKLRDLLLTRSRLVAQRTGIQEIAYLEDLPKPAPSPTLREIGQLYLDKASIKSHEMRKSRLFWREFRERVGVDTLRELNVECIADYYDTILNAGQSQTYVKHRFGKIKTILRFAAKRGLAPEEVTTVLSRCAILQPPKAKTADPHPISTSDFFKLFKAADEKWRACLLCSLNFCMYAAEIGTVERREIDLDNLTLVTDRGKTGVTRVAVAWPRTVQAIKRLPENGSSFLLTSSIGTQYHADHIRRNFDRLRKKAGVSDDVKFADIRDGAYTAAVQGEGVQFEHARILGGHRTGMSDHYVKRNPKMVAGACKAIESHYFK